MTTRAGHFSGIVFGLCGASLATLLGAGCATEATGVLTASMTPEQYAQLAEQQCAGVPVKEQEKGILAYRDAIAGAQPLKDPYQVGKVKLTRDAGVQISIRAQPSLNAPWLERVATCHMALARSGRITPSASDPFAVPGATVHVEEAYTGYVVQLHVGDAEGAKDVTNRTAVALTTLSGPVTAVHGAE